MRISNKMLLAVVGVLLVLAAASGLLLLRSRPQGTQVRVTVDSQLYGTYDLLENQTVRISPADNRWYNILVIQDGKAAVTESDCSNQICVHTPALSEEVTGLIVCLPHGVIVELTEE